MWCERKAKEVSCQEARSKSTDRGNFLQKPTLTQQVVPLLINTAALHSWCFNWHTRELWPISAYIHNYSHFLYLKLTDKKMLVWWEALEDLYRNTKHTHTQWWCLFPEPGGVFLCSTKYKKKEKNSHTHQRKTKSIFYSPCWKHTLYHRPCSSSPPHKSPSYLTVWIA